MPSRTVNIILGGLAAAAVVGGGVLAIQPDEIKLKNPQKIVWEKPTTDEQWAEDVKAENFDIKSTGVLETMIDSHVTKLSKNEKAFEKYQNCKDCLYWEKYYQLRDAYPDMSKSWVEDEARAAADTEYAQRLWEIEKIQQSVERMHKEIELREKGFVVVEGEKKTDLLGGISSVPPERVRKIND